MRHPEHKKAPERGSGGASMNDLQKLYGPTKYSPAQRQREGIDGLLSRLERVRQTGPGRWIARCPGHDDRGPSLSLCETDDGRTLIHCFAGCELGAILAALGLTLADLFPDRGGHHRPAGRPRIPAPAVLSAIVTECWIVATVASDVSNGFDVNPGNAGSGCS